MSKPILRQYPMLVFSLFAIVLLLLGMPTNRVRAEIPENCAVTADLISGPQELVWTDGLGASVPSKGGRKPPTTADIVKVQETVQAVIIVVDDFSFVPKDSLFTHGELVRDLVETEARSYSGIAVDQVNIADIPGATTAEVFRTGVVAQAITSKIEEWQVNQGVTNFVLNMSFAIISCNGEMREFLTSQIPQKSAGTASNLAALPSNATVLQEEPLYPENSLMAVYGEGEIVNLLANAAGINAEVPLHKDTDLTGRINNLLAQNMTINDIIQNVAGEFSIEPLRLLPLVYQLREQGSVVSVAAAGNYRLLFEAQGLAPLPVYPARWPEYISVSALTEDQQPAPWSNFGQIAALGGMYDRSGEPYFGTSFAAPLVSVSAAVDLLAGSGCPTRIPEDLLGVYDNALYGDAVSGMIASARC